jgi:hypothetical protein
MASISAHQIADHLDNLIEAFTHEPEHLSPVDTLRLAKDSLLHYLHDYQDSVSVENTVIAPPLP